MESVNNQIPISYFRYWGKARPKNEDARNTYHLLPYHSLDVAAVGNILLGRHKALTKALSESLGLPPEVFRSWAVYFLALHDIGKFAQGFQCLAPEVFKKLQSVTPTKVYQTRHDTFGYAIWLRRLRQDFKQTDPLRLGDALDDAIGAFNIWMGCVTGHHGRPPERAPASLDIEASQRDIDAAANFMCDAKFLLSGDFAVRFDVEGFEWAMPAVSWWLAGFAVLCDWLGSNQKYFPYETRVDLGLEAYWSRALTQAEVAIANSHTLPAPVGPLHDIQNFLPKRAKPTALQRLAQSLKVNREPQVFILEDLTGSGKTEAATMLAHRIMQQNGADGVFFALPTMATANAMYSRIQSFHPLLFESTQAASLVLAHSQRKLVEEFTATVLMPESPELETIPQSDEVSASTRCAAWLADNTKKALLASVGVGTIDQALMGILHSRHQSMRLLGLFRKVLIVDEVHANDDYVHRLLSVLLRFHAAAGGSAILLSATLPEKMRAELLEAFAQGRNIETIEPSVNNAYPMLTRWNGSDGVVTHAVAASGRVTRHVEVKLVHEPDAALALILEVVQTGRCVCWIRNTVNDAIQVYSELLSTLGDKVELFHARFMMGDRLDIERAVQSRFGIRSDSAQRRGRVLIATQVAEQSLDLDFDVMISDLAPIDLLIQRAGRLHRHPRDSDGNIKAEGGDKRGLPRLTVLSPNPIPDAGRNWLNRLLPGTAAVYPDHAALWRTARLVQERGALCMPDDARLLIEGVYGQDGIPVPEELASVGREVEGRDKADSSLATYNSLDFSEGYRAGSQLWFPEAQTPTRLGEPTSQLCLLEWNDERLRPLYREGTDFPWQMSQVSIRRWHVAAEAEPSDRRLGDALERCREDQPFLKSWVLLVPMAQRDDATWHGNALDERGRRVELNYRLETGLSVKQVNA